VSLQQPLPRSQESPVAAASDGELLEAIAGGSDGAFEELRRRYRRVIEHTCRGLLRGDQADDCAQEAFARIWQKAPLFDRQRGSAAGWLLTVTRNVAHNLAAKKTPEPLPLPDEIGLDAEESAHAIDTVWLDEALAQLTAHERRVIELAYFADLTQSQIAARLGLPLGTVKSWTRRGLNHLAMLVDAEGPR
jgi:RNA polymerase sigma-70 factor (ECF subfamily)